LASEAEIIFGSLHEWNLSAASTSFRVVSLATVWKHFGQMELKVSFAVRFRGKPFADFSMSIPSQVEIREGPGRAAG
jgi:hypothetical protein